MFLSEYLILGGLLFCIGLIGILLNRKHILMVLIAVEVMLLGVNINLVGFSNIKHNLDGQILALFVLTVAAAEAAVGLALLLVYFKKHGNIAITNQERMHG